MLSFGWARSDAYELPTPETRPNFAYSVTPVNLDCRQRSERNAKMSNDPVASVHAAASASDLIRAVASVRRDGGSAFALGDTPVRLLTPEEIAALESCGCTCAAWSRILVADGFDVRRVRRTTFLGDVVLGRFTGEIGVADGVTMPAGVYDSAVSHSVIGNNALIRDVKLLHNYVVGEAALVFDCGRVTCTGPTAFGNGVELSLGIEGGGREVRAFAEIDLNTAAAMATRRTEPDLQRRYRQAVSEYVAQATSARGIVERGAVVRGTPHVFNTFVGAHAAIDGATSVSHCTLLSQEEEPVRILSGACVNRTLLQWGSQVRTLAVVERSVLAEQAYAERHAKVMTSFVGPSSGVAEGEIAASLVGPLVGFHHQALLIAVLWPEGKGNVSHGANLGANHTSRTPDQEFRPGEGAFFGLGVSIMYPADFSQAPYSLIASGVRTLPQKLAFPFALVNAPAAQFPGISTAYNELFPAWMLTDNLYALCRNEKKYHERNRARRTPVETTLFRLDILRLMRDARRRLEAVPAIRDVYTEREIAGLGKNYLLDSHRRRAIDAYRFHLLYHGLLGLKARVEGFLDQNAEGSVDGLLNNPGSQPLWEFHRQVVREEGGYQEVAHALEALPPRLEAFAFDVEQSRMKDDERGSRIIDDYAAVHTPAAADPLVRQTWDEAHRFCGETQELLRRLALRAPATVR
jgi:hypothetical protein